MIPRYTRPEMAKIWEPENRFRIWLEIETLACEKQADLGVIPAEAVKVIRQKGLSISTASTPSRRKSSMT